MARPGELSSGFRRDSVGPHPRWVWTYVLSGTLGLMQPISSHWQGIQLEFALTLTALLAIGLAGYGWYLTRRINLAEKRISHLGTLDQNQRG